MLFKHGKRSREYINSVSRSSTSAATHSQPQTQYDPSLDYDHLTTLQPCPTVVRQSSQGHGSPQPHSQSLPTSIDVSSYFINREINDLTDDLCSVKADIASLRRHPPVPLPSSLQAKLGHEIRNLKHEIDIIRQQMSNRSKVSSQPGSQPTSSANSIYHISITSWNCRGIMNATLYLNQLIQDGSDIIAISEHWLWPYQLHLLNSVHPDFVSFGFSDNRLNENSNLNRGCGGVGFIWRRSIMASPVNSIS